MFDAHAHLKSAPGTPGSGWVIPGVDLQSEALARDLLARDPRLVAALGLHPWHLPEALDEALAELDALAASRRPIAIGETGLDKGRRGAPKELQRRAFAHQARLAKRLDLPLILHVVRSHGACLDLLEAEGFDGGGMVHDFQGPAQMIPRWVEAGFCLSISPRGQDKAELIAAIPEPSLLVETDDAGPEALVAVIERVAAAREQPVEAITALTEANARRLFRI